MNLRNFIRPYHTVWIRIFVHIYSTYICTFAIITFFRIYHPLFFSCLSLSQRCRKHINEGNPKIVYPTCLVTLSSSINNGHAFKLTYIRSQPASCCYSLLVDVSKIRDFRASRRRNFLLF